MHFFCLFPDAPHQVFQLGNLLTLLPLCSDPVAPYLVEIVKSYLENPTDNEDTKEVARIMALCMNAIAKRDAKEWIELVDLQTWTRAGLANWASSHEFVSGLVAVAQAW